MSQVTATTSVAVDEAITGLTAANDSPTVLGHATTFTATITNGTNVSYTWALGDGSGSSGAIISHTYAAVDLYTAVVTASNSVGEITATTPAVVVDEAIAGLTAANDSPTALRHVTTFSAVISSGTNVSYTWDLGDGSGGSGAIMTHTYATIGLYTATVTAANSINSLTATTPITIFVRRYPIYLPLVVRDYAAPVEPTVEPTEEPTAEPTVTPTDRTAGRAANHL